MGCGCWGRCIGCIGCVGGSVNDFEKLDAKLDEVLRRLGRGDVSLANLEVRLKLLERIVYPIVGIIVLTVIGCLLSTVLPG